MKILVIYATAGAGHRKAAEAIFNGIKAHIDHDVQCLDALDYTSPFYKNIYQKTYLFLISRCSWLWGFFFWLAGVGFLLPIVQFLRRVFNAQNGKKLHAFLKKENFDCIISTHFFSNEVASFLKRKGVINSKIICVVTDYDAHNIWLSKGIDCYSVACDFTRNRLLSYGVDESMVSITGIPTDEKFSMQVEVDSLKDKLDLKKDKFTVLLATGSFGIGPIEEIIGRLTSVQCVVVCGHNKKLFKKLEKKNLSYVKACGFIDNMDEYMKASNAIITKPGGLSISESLVVGLPMIFFSAIPGQETNNIKVLKSYGVGVSGLSVLEMSEEIKALNTSREYYHSMREKIHALARPNAVSDILQLISKDD